MTSLKFGPNGLEYIGTITNQTTDDSDDTSTGLTINNKRFKITINSSFNISSIVDNGAGKYEANLSVTMSSATYCVVGGSSQSNDRNDNVMGFHPYTATKIRMYSWQQTGSSTAGEDATFVSAAVFYEMLMIF